MKMSDAAPLSRTPGGINYDRRDEEPHQIGALSFLTEIVTP